MAAGEGEEVVPKTVLEAVLGCKRNGVVLHKNLIQCSVPYLLTITSHESEEELMSELPVTPKEWMEMFDESWATVSEKLMPSLISGRAKVWSGFPSDASAAASPTVAKGALGGGGVGGSSGKAPMHTNLNTSAGNDTYIAEMMDGLVVSDHDVPKAISDILAQRISGLRCVALSLALMSGHVHPAGESAEWRFGSDLRLCQLIRQQRKAGVQSLDDVLKAKSKRGLAQHYSRLAKEYNDRGMIEEATLVSQFWAETASAFEGDDANLFVYISEWNRTYAGRGIPKILDTDLILRHRKHEGGGASSSDLKKVEEAVKSTKEELRKSDERNAALMKRLQKLETKADNTGEKGDKQCFICGGDHLARNCPEKKKNKKKEENQSGDD